MRSVFVFFLLLLSLNVFSQPDEWFWQRRDYLPQKELLVEDFTYESTIRSVQLFPRSGAVNSVLLPPIIPLSQRTPLVLSFDEIGEEANYYEVKILHCNYDWSFSQLRPNEYLSVYNGIRLQDFEFSVGTKVPYTHFTFEVPRVKVSGNYLLKVYRENNENDLIITKRFVVYEDGTQIGGKIENLRGGESFLRKQQLSFVANYGGLKVEIPQKTIKATIRQNFRWDNAIYDLPPLFVRENNNLMEFTYFNMENSFWGGNEFRNFDFRRFNGGVLNIRKTDLLPNMNRLGTYANKPWAGRVYNQQRQDQNGRRIIGNFDTPDDPSIGADYGVVGLTLEVENAYDGDVYLIGSFNDWQLLDEYRMEYVEAKGTYKANLFLKQGYYDYRYTVYDPKTQVKDDYTVDGTHNRTRNEYEVILYYRPLGSRADRVIGYKKIE